MDYPLNFTFKVESPKARTGSRSSPGLSENAPGEGLDHLWEIYYETLRGKTGGMRFLQASTWFCCRIFLLYKKPRLAGSNPIIDDVSLYDFRSFSGRISGCHQQYISNRIKCPLFTEFFHDKPSTFYVYISCFLELFIFFCVCFAFFLKTTTNLPTKKKTTSRTTLS